MGYVCVMPTILKNHPSIQKPGDNMPFDKSLDQKLFAETVEFETTRITVGVFSYNEGEKKLQLSRENRNPNTGDWSFAKLGRMIREEAEAVIPHMQKAVEVMKEGSEGSEEKSE
jgi:hypothetical protein